MSASSPLRARGVTLALGSALASSGVYVVGKWFLTHEVPLLDFLFLWFFAGFLYVGAAFVLFGRGHLISQSFRAWPLLLAFGAGHLASVTLFFGALRALDPAVVAWLSQLDFAFAAALGILWLREHILRREVAGFALVLAGAAALGISQRAIGGAGVLMVLGSAVIEGVMAAASKKLHPRLDMRTMAFHRTWLIAASVFAVRAAQGQPLWPDVSGETAAGIALGALFGPALGFGLYYMALARTTVHRAATVKAVQPILVLALAWALFGKTPSAGALAGGLFVTAGVLLVFPRRGEE